VTQFAFLAKPWWVNLLIFVPAVAFFSFKSRKPEITRPQLFAAAIFGIAFGFVEATVVDYLRAASGLLPGYLGSLSDVIQQSPADYQELQTLANVPRSLLTVEIFREVATLVMLVSLAMLSATKMKERCAMFLWVFAFWDISYYLGMWLTIRWPNSFTATDVLFLIPVPWISQVWFPCLISGLTIIVVAMSAQKREFPAK